MREASLQSLRAGLGHGDVPAVGWFQSLLGETRDVFLRLEVVPEVRHVYVSPSIYAMSGYTAEEFCRDPSLLLRTIHPDDRAQLASMIASKAPPPPVVMLRFVHRDGRIIWTEHHCVGVYDSAGKLVAVEGVVRDITARKDTEEALRTSREMLRGVLDHFPGSVCWKDRNSVYLGCNVACARAAGVPSPAEIIGKTDYDLPWARTEADAYRADDKLVMDGGVSKLGIVETQLRSDGQVIWLETNKIPMFDAQGNVVGIMVVSSDITQRRRAEEQSRLAREAAEVANRAKDQFLARLSHELRTPLTPVLTSVQLMEQDADVPEHIRESLRLIRRNVDLETRLIDDLLDLTRIEQGKLELHCQPVDLHQQIQNALEMCNGEIAEKAILVSADFRAEDHYVSADAARLQQILWNLLKNAVKFTPSHGSVHLKSYGVKPGRVAVSVHDTGVGIDPEAIPRIFMAFEQGSRDVTRRYGGMGLGLAISNSLAELHGGRLSAYSDGAGKGAVFTLELPTVASPAAETARPRCPQPLTTNLRGIRVLLVEDHADTAGVLALVLGRYGCDVRVAYSVAGAIQAARDEMFDLLISDIGLPDGTGTDLMRTLRANSTIKGIALSGYGMDHDIQRSLDAGFNSHLTKPVSLARLHEVIQQVIAL